jgi:hypothetical protein
MGELTNGVNWLAVGLGTVLSFALGAGWYSGAMFGTKWRQGVNLPPGDSGGMVAAMVVQFIATFLLAWLIGITAVSNALLLAILIVLGMAIMQAANGLFIGKSSYAIAAEAGFILAMAVIMIACQAIL